MSFLDKLYTCQSHENFDTWLKAAGVPDDKAAAITSGKSTQKYGKNGDSYTFTESFAGVDKTTTFKSGVEFDDTLPDKTPIKTTITVDGNTVTQVLKTSNGTATFKRIFNGDDLVVEITGDSYNGVAKRFYKA